MLVKTYGSAVFGVNALTITIEVNISAGTKYYMVGLPDNAIKESLRRIESAIQSAGLSNAKAENCNQPRTCRYQKRRLSI